MDVDATTFAQIRRIALLGEQPLAPTLAFLQVGLATALSGASVGHRMAAILGAFESAAPETVDAALAILDVVEEGV